MATRKAAVKTRKKPAKAAKKPAPVKKKAPKKRLAPKKPAATKKSAAAGATKKPAPKKPATATRADSRSIEALAKKVATVSTDTKSLSKDFKTIAKIFGDNQKILVSMKSMIDELVGTLETIQKQSKKIGSLESDSQKLFDGLGEMRAHARMIAKLDSQAAKMHEAVRGMDERTRISGGIENISKKVNENSDSIKNNAQMIIKVGRHIDKIREDLSSATKPSAIKEVHSEIARLRELFREAQEKHAADPGITREISALSAKMAELSQLPVEISSIQKHLQELSSASDTLPPIVGKLQDQLTRVVSKVDSAGSLESVKSEFASLRDEVLGRASKADAGIASLSESLKRSEKSVAEFHQKSDALFEAVKSIGGREDETSAQSTSEVMAMLRLSEFQSNVRMTSESKYGEVSDLEKIAEQTVDVLNVFDKLAVETGSDVALPRGVRQWAVSKILECSDRWEIRFSDVLGVLREKLGVKLLGESVRMGQVRDIFGTRAVDEIESVLAGN